MVPPRRRARRSRGHVRAGHVPTRRTRRSGRSRRGGETLGAGRLAQILATGRGLAADPVEAIKWHLVSKAGGEKDAQLDDFINKQPPDIRAAGEKAAQPFLAAIKASHS